MSQYRPRRRLSQAEREDQIISATMRVVADRGYGSASLDAVAEHAGVSKGLVSHYFANRENLLRRTAHQALRELRRAVATDIDMSAPAPRVLREALLAAAHLPETHPAQLSALQQIVLNLRDPDGTQSLTLHDYESTFASQEEQIFRRGQEEGDFRSDLDSRVLAVSYQGAVDAMLAYLKAYPSTDARHHAEHVASILLEGIEERR